MSGPRASVLRRRRVVRRASAPTATAGPRRWAARPPLALRQLTPAPERQSGRSRDLPGPAASSFRRVSVAEDELAADQRRRPRPTRGAARRRPRGAARRRARARRGRRPGPAVGGGEQLLDPAAGPRTRRGRGRPPPAGRRPVADQPGGAVGDLAEHLGELGQVVAVLLGRQRRGVGVGDLRPGGDLGEVVAPRAGAEAGQVGRGVEEEDLAVPAQEAGDVVDVAAQRDGRRPRARRPRPAGCRRPPRTPPPRRPRPGRGLCRSPPPAMVRTPAADAPVPRTSTVSISSSSSSSSVVHGVGVLGLGRRGVVVERDGAGAGPVEVLAELLDDVLPQLVEGGADAQPRRPRRSGRRTPRRPGRASRSRAWRPARRRPRTRSRRRRRRRPRLSSADVSRHSASRLTMSIVAASSSTAQRSGCSAAMS